MRFFTSLLASLGLLAVSCGDRNDLQCKQDSVCDLANGGVCQDPGLGTGNRWCAYPDSNCPSGLRYSDVQVGDGVSGQCTPRVNPTISCAALPYTCGAEHNDDCCHTLD